MIPYLNNESISNFPLVMIDGISDVSLGSVLLHICFQERAGDLRLPRVVWGQEDYTTA